MTPASKLVRDRIPEIIRANGDTCETAVMTAQEYEAALRAKLVEEAREVAAADCDALVAELADLYEVIDTLMLTLRIAPEAVRHAQQRRRAERGGFTGRIRLLTTERAWRGV